MLQRVVFWAGRRLSLGLCPSPFPFSPLPLMPSAIPMFGSEALSLQDNLVALEDVFRRSEGSVTGHRSIE